MPQPVSRALTAKLVSRVEFVAAETKALAALRWTSADSMMALNNVLWIASRTALASASGASYS